VTAMKRRVLTRDGPFSKVLPASRMSAIRAPTKVASPPAAPSQTLASEAGPTRTRQRKRARTLATQSASLALPSRVCVSSVLIR
jgi:hypothetical protein